LHITNNCFITAFITPCFENLLNLRKISNIYF